MSLMLARRSRVVFRHLNVTEPSFTSGRVSLALHDAQHATHSSSAVTVTKAGVVGAVYPSIASRSYASVGKPKAHTGKTKASAKPKKPAAAKTTTKKPVKKAAKKTAVKKPKPQGRPKKEVSKEQKDALKRKNEITALKETALKAPKQLPASTFQVLVNEIIREKGFTTISDVAKQASETYKNLTPQHRQELEQISDSNKSLNRTAYDSWIQSHTPLQIKDANRARLRLSKLSKEEQNSKAKQLPQLVDPRQVKKPTNALFLFGSELRAAGEFKDMPVGEAGKMTASRFAQLSEHEKEKYNEMAAQDRARYFRQYKEAYGTDPPFASKKE
ncbi:hypothetical protein FQN54_005663 [Arachnomyces sp. PD_36]|nr:hypothetical protein FQN54_005663 [Arachnomyces sp. PD_36]